MRSVWGLFGGTGGTGGDRVELVENENSAWAVLREWGETERSVAYSLLSSALLRLHFSLEVWTGCNGMCVGDEGGGRGEHVGHTETSPALESLCSRVHIERVLVYIVMS